ncbi:ribonuclease E inhibitor RraA/Dimethylmenaquinone methyltransferase [Aspergillus nidulans var. acristatus]
MRSPAALGSPPTLRINGPAVTVKMTEVETSSAAQAPIPSIHFADANRPGAIMYIQQPKGLYSACLGGLMSTQAKAAGALGVVVDWRGDLWVHPGDVLMGDEDGVVVVPPSSMEKVVGLCREWEIDLKTVEALRKGQLMGPTIKRLRK